MRRLAWEPASAYAPLTAAAGILPQSLAEGANRGVARECCRMTLPSMPLLPFLSYMRHARFQQPTPSRCIDLGNSKRIRILERNPVCRLQLRRVLLTTPTNIRARSACATKRGVAKTWKPEAFYRPDFTSRPTPPTHPTRPLVHSRRS